MVAHFICILFTGFVMYTAKPGSSLFSWHPTLMTLAFGFLMVQALLAFSPHSSLLPSAARITKVRLHWILNSLATLAAILGVSAIYMNKTNNGKPHFKSWHGLIGLVTCLYAVIQSIAGIAPLYNPQFLRNIFRLADLKLYHATSGCMLMIFVTVSLVLGMQSNWFTSQVTGTGWYACALCPILIGWILSQQVIQAYLKKRGPIEVNKSN